MAYEKGFLQYWLINYYCDSLSQGPLDLFFLAWSPGYRTSCPNMCYVVSGDVAVIWVFLVPHTGKKQFVLLALIS